MKKIVSKIFAILFPYVRSFLPFPADNHKKTKSPLKTAKPINGYPTSGRQNIPNKSIFPVFPL